jgi:tRNA(fMet)-specific endonuclease VapC
MTYVLDTNILLQIIRENDTFADLLDNYELFSPSNETYISIVTVGELRSIARQNSWGLKKKKLLEDLSRLCQPVAIEKQLIVDAYAEIDAFSNGKLSENPLPKGMSARNMGKNDLWIAATTHVLEATLITTDGDFTHLKDVYMGLEYIQPS